MIQVAGFKLMQNFSLSKYDHQLTRKYNVFKIDGQSALYYLMYYWHSNLQTVFGFTVPKIVI